MSETVYFWEVYCLTTASYQYVWNTVEPTTCPENAAHVISTNPGPRIIRQISSQQVKITEEEKLPTQGIYRFKGYEHNIPAGNVGNVTLMDITWNYPITLLNGYIISTDEMVNDKMEVCLSPNTTVGAISAPALIGESTITVTSTVFDVIYKGWNINITDGVNNDFMGECIDINTGNSQITCEYPLTHNFSPLSPTYVQLTPILIQGLVIQSPNQRFPIAEKKIGGRSIPPGISFHVRYTNNTGNAKVFYFYIEYLY